MQNASNFVVKSLTTDSSGYVIRAVSTTTAGPGGLVIIHTEEEKRLVFVKESEDYLVPDIPPKVVHVPVFPTASVTTPTSNDVGTNTEVPNTVCNSTQTNTSEQPSPTEPAPNPPPDQPPEPGVNANPSTSQLGSSEPTNHDPGETKSNQKPSSCQSTNQDLGPSQSSNQNLEPSQPTKQSSVLHPTSPQQGSPQHTNQEPGPSKSPDEQQEIHVERIRKCKPYKNRKRNISPGGKSSLSSFSSCNEFSDHEEDQVQRITIEIIGKVNQINNQ